MRKGLKEIFRGSCAMALVLAATAGSASAAGFALRESSAAQMGTAFAGSGSLADDLSTIFYNPAGMTYLRGNQAEFVGTGIMPNIHFEGSGFSPTFGPGGAFAGFAPSSGDLGGNGADSAFVPSLFGMVELTPDLRLGLGVTAPFGLHTDYNPTWVGRYLATDSEVQSTDINPSLAYRVNRWLSIGGGVSAQHFDANLNRNVNLTAATGGALGPLPDANLRIHGDSWAFGYNFGALVEPLAGTRVGVAYRSKLEHRIDGGADVNLPALPAPVVGALTAGGLSSSHAHVGLDTPDSLLVSLTQAITPQLKLVSDFEWTGWGNVKTLTVNRDNNTPLLLAFNNRDAVFASLGAVYTLNPTWTFRIGAGYDQTPVTNEFRTAILPDQDRYMLAAGVGYNLTENVRLDFGYLHFFLPDAGISNSANAVSPTGEVLQGKFSLDADEVALSLKMAF